MNNTRCTDAITRLGLIADSGFAVISDTSNSGLQLLTSTYEPKWTNQSVIDWKSADDPLLTWLSTNIGAIAAADLDTGDSVATGVDPAHTTLISEFYGGRRVGVILSHTSETLDETQVSEARAAALVIQSMQPEETEFGISAKELIYLKQVSSGATDDEIASDLQLSLRAVKERKRKAIDDLHAKNISHAIGIAKRATLI